MRVSSSQDASTRSSRKMPATTVALGGGAWNNLMANARELDASSWHTDVLAHQHTDPRSMALDSEGFVVRVGQLKINKPNTTQQNAAMNPFEN